jgi:hypothetical protein
LLNYERIKAKILSGEETDPEMLEWLIEIEEEMALEEAECEEEDGEGDRVTKAKHTKIIQNQGYTLPNQKTALQPHATFVYGPWGKYEMESAMLLSNAHGLQPCTDFDPTTSTTTKKSQFHLAYPIFDYKIPDQTLGDKDKVCVMTTDVNIIISLIIHTFIAHFTQTETQNAPLCCTLSSDYISADDGQQQQQPQFTLTITSNSTYDPQSIISALSLSSQTQDAESKPRTCVGIEITPVKVNFDILQAIPTTPSTLPQTLSILATLTEVINAMYTNYLDSIIDGIQSNKNKAKMIKNDAEKFPLVPISSPQRPPPPPEAIKSTKQLTKSRVIATSDIAAMMSTR